MIKEAEILNARVLIVDDQEPNIALLAQMLSESGYQHVESTRNPLEVCALHLTHPYDLILLDLEMPVLDGFGVMDALRAVSGQGVLPVIAITAQDRHKLRALQCGARDFVSKPFNVTELRTRIRNTLEVCLLLRLLQDRNVELEARVQERTAQLRESEARFQALTELASDWYWEQDHTGAFVKVTGPVLDMLGVRTSTEQHGEWNPSQHAQLMQHIAERQPFLDFVLCRRFADGTEQCFKISGQPVFDRLSAYIGYRGVGLEVPLHH